MYREWVRSHSTRFNWFTRIIKILNRTSAQHKYGYDDIISHNNIGYAFYVKNNENRLIFITFRFSNEKLYWWQSPNRSLLQLFPTKTHFSWCSGTKLSFRSAELFKINIKCSKSKSHAVAQSNLARSFGWAWVSDDILLINCYLLRKTSIKAPSHHIKLDLGKITNDMIARWKENEENEK